MTTIIHPDFPYLRIEIDGHTRCSIEYCDRCGKQDLFDGTDTMLNALNGGSSFIQQHRLPNCGANGLRDLMADSQKWQETVTMDWGEQNDN